MAIRQFHYGMSAIGLIWIEGINTQTIQLLVVPVMIIVGYIFFYTGLLHGGADAKAFMTIAVLVPFSPIVGEILPLIQYALTNIFSLFRIDLEYRIAILLALGVFKYQEVTLAVY